MSSTATHRTTADDVQHAKSSSDAVTLRSKLFARVWRMIDDSVDEQIRPAKEALLGELPERIVEIGPGRGSNFSYYGRGKQVLAIEPNALFHSDLREAGLEHGIDLELRGGDLGSATLPDASEDVVVSTLVLCSVGDVDAELAEIRRVLRPGGRLVFIEHVAGRPRSVLSFAQRLLRRPWRFVADGCDLCAGTHPAIERAGFQKVHAKLERLGPALDPSSTTYWGVAER